MARRDLPCFRCDEFGHNDREHDLCAFADRAPLCRWQVVSGTPTCPLGAVRVRCLKRHLRGGLPPMAAAGPELRNTEPGSEHAVDLYCVVCDHLIVRAADIYRIKHQNVWTARTTNTTTGVTESLNPYKQTPSRIVRCNKCHNMLGWQYDDLLDDGWPFEGRIAFKLCVVARHNAPRRAPILANTWLSVKSASDRLTAAAAEAKHVPLGDPVRPKRDFEDKVRLVRPHLSDADIAALLRDPEARIELAALVAEQQANESSATAPVTAPAAAAAATTSQ